MLYVCGFLRAEIQEDLQKLAPGFPRVAPQPPFPPLVPTMAQMHLMPTQNMQPTQQLEYKVHTHTFSGNSSDVDSG